jgi:hypothetical protein
LIGNNKARLPALVVRLDCLSHLNHSIAHAGRLQAAASLRESRINLTDDLTRIIRATDVQMVGDGTAPRFVMLVVATQAVPATMRLHR